MNHRLRNTLEKSALLSSNCPIKTVSFSYASNCLFGLCGEMGWCLFGLCGEMDWCLFGLCGELGCWCLFSDYDAPLSESGQLTEKYYKTVELLSQYQHELVYLPAKEPAGPQPPIQPPVSYSKGLISTSLHLT